MPPTCPFCSELRALTKNPIAKCASCLSREGQREIERGVSQRLDRLEVFIEELKSVLREKGLPEDDEMVKEVVKRVARLVLE